MYNIVVSGASSGIGAAIALDLCRNGHKVIVCARRLQRLKELFSAEHKALIVQCDVSDIDSVRGLADFSREHFDSVDVLINCAGIIGAVGPFYTTCPNAWMEAFRVNVFGTYAVSHAMVPMLRNSEHHPRIINFSGGGAFNPFPNMSAYAASKAAIIRLTENQAVELADIGICVNAVAPGFVNTDIHDQVLIAGVDNIGRGYYDEIIRKKADGSAVDISIPVACVNFLLSDAAIGLTGKTLSASFDPWAEPMFSSLIQEINKSDVYTMRRINVRNLSSSDKLKILDR